MIYIYQSDKTLSQLMAIIHLNNTPQVYYCYWSIYSAPLWKNVVLIRIEQHWFWRVRYFV